MDTFSILRYLFKRVLNFLKNFKNSTLALIGLIVLFAFSLVMANGGEFPISYPEIRVTELSSEENKAIDNSYLKTVVDETLRIVQKGPKTAEEHYNFLQFVRFWRTWNRFGAHPLLIKIFPAVTFYRVYSSSTLPETPYLKAEANGKYYDLPSGFNRLILDNSLEINDTNIIKLAKAFVVITFADRLGFFPKITFLEGKRSVDKKKTPPIYRVHLKVRVKDEIQIYGFNIQNGQIQWATMNVEGKTSTKYFDFEIIENHYNK